MSQETLPEALIPPAPGAATVVDISKGSHRQTSPERERQWSPPPVHYPAVPKQRASWQAAIFGVILILRGFTESELGELQSISPGQTSV